MATFVNGITVARKQAHLTQQQLADIMHVSLRTVSRWEKIPPEEIAGAKIPFGALAHALGVTTDELMTAPSEDNKKAPAGSPGEGDNYGIQLNNSANSGTITQTVTPSPHAVQSSDDLEAALRLRRDRPEVVKMLPDPDYSDDMIRAVYERMPKSAKQG